MPDNGQAHDRLFKALTDNPAAAGALLRERLPPELAMLLADAPPEPLPGSFIDPGLRESHSDRLFRVALRGGGAALLYTLVEHKSAPEQLLHLQLLGYMLRIWQREVSSPDPAQRALPAIIPLVLYHGTRRWTVPRAFFDLLALDDDAAGALRGHHLDFRYTLVDLGAIADDALHKRHALLEVFHAGGGIVNRRQIGVVFQCEAMFAVIELGAHTDRRLDSGAVERGFTALPVLWADQ